MAAAVMFGAFFKALQSMRHTGPSSFLLGLLSRTKFDYAKEIGTGIDASVVMAPIQWIQRAWVEAELRVVVKRGGEIEEVENHDLTALIDRPNEAYAGSHLWAATLFSYLTAGNAYWLKVKSASGKVVELWYVPHWLITAKWPSDGSTFISHYEYKPGGGMPIRLEPEDVVHFRHGIDPRNIRMGLSPLHSVIREVFMDVESSNFISALLRNMGVPGVVISPDGDAVATPDEGQAVKTWFNEQFGGDRRGSVLVMSTKTKVQQYGFNPQQMDLSVVRDVAEERVCAVLGIPAAVVGFGTGLQQTKVGATMAELRKLAWTNGVIPLQRAFADELQRSLMPEFATAGKGTVIEFDLTGVMALEDDMNQRATRMDIGVRGGWVTVADARRAMGLDVEKADDIYLRGLTMVEVPVGATMQQLLPPPTGDGGKVVPLLPLIKSEHTQAEERISHNPKRKPTLAQARYVAILARQLPRLSVSFEKRLGAFFAKLGKEIADAAGPILEETFKRSAEDALIVERIFLEANMVASQNVLKQMYEAVYLDVAEQAGDAANVLGLGVKLPDPVARAVIATGGRRAGLLDLTAKAKASLFSALTEGRAAGEGAAALARRIRDEIPKGPWSSAKARARVVARTETAFAQNTSTIERSREAGLDQALVFDNRTGFDDDICSAMDGIIVTLAEAEVLTADEHPNGTRSFSPYFEDTG